MGLSQYRQRAALVGGWYPAPDPKGWSKLRRRTTPKTYGASPPRIASLAYDAVSLAVSLSGNPPGQRYTCDAADAGERLLRASTACSGLLHDGTSERGLAILEVRDGGPQVIEPAPSQFRHRLNY